MEDPQADRPKPSALVAWLAVAAWAVLVLGLGSDGFSQSSTSKLLLATLRWLLPDADPASLLQIQYGLRKAAHFVEYALFAILGYRALRMSFAIPWLGQLLAAVVLVCVVAAADEARQSRSAVRSGKLADVGLDVAGGAAGLALAASLRRSQRGRRWFPSRAPDG